MGRISKPPRLWLHPERKDALGRTTHDATWLILDGTKRVRTGFASHQRTEAEGALLDYCDATAESRKTSAKFPDLYLYFVTADVDGFPIKIGISEVPRLRMGSLQSGLPYDLKLVAMIKIPDTLFERRIHRKFARFRLRGEWFKRCQEIFDYAEHLSTANATANVGTEQIAISTYL